MYIGDLLRCAILEIFIVNYDEESLWYPDWLVKAPLTKTDRNKLFRNKKKVCDENVTKNRNEVTFSAFQFILVVYLSVWKIFADANFMVVFLCSLCGLRYGWYVLRPNQIEPRKKLPIHSRHDGMSSFIFTVSNNLSIAGVCSKR